MDDHYTAAILLGASEFPSHSLEANPAFRTSSIEFKRYLRSTTRGLGLQEGDIKDLFGSALSASEQIEAIADFIEGLRARAASSSARNLIIYYVGHGLFPTGRREYHLAVSGVKSGREVNTALRFAALNDVLKAAASGYRQFYMIDACYGAEIIRESMSTPAQSALSAIYTAVGRQAVLYDEEVPRSGVAALCAANQDSTADAPRKFARTMFTGALLDVLENGEQDAPRLLSLALVRDLVEKRLRRIHRDAVIPVVGSPQQPEGDIAQRVALFPNFGHVARRAQRVSALPIDARETAGGSGLLDAVSENVGPETPRPSRDPSRTRRWITQKRRLFIVLAVLIVFVATAYFTNKFLFARQTEIETYFNRSVESLAVGSPVKYRGVLVGEVSSVGFTDQMYEREKPNMQRTRYIIVKAMIAPRLTPTSFDPESIKLEVERGLRIRLHQGSSGSNYLDIDYFDPPPPLLQIPWMPSSVYIPSSY